MAAHLRPSRVHLVCVSSESWRARCIEPQAGISPPFSLRCAQLVAFDTLNLISPLCGSLSISLVRFHF